MPFFSGFCDNTSKLIDKTVVITGCSSGIGKEIVRDFYERGARIIMLNRDLNKTIETINEIEKKCCHLKNKGQLVFVYCDLASLKSVRECARKILETESHITILINNAGVMMCPKVTTVDGFEMHFGIYLGHFYLTMLLLPRIKISVPARIISVSSYLHSLFDMNFEDIHFEKQPYDPLKAYSQSNLANVLFSKELAAKLKEYNIDGINTYCVQPGFTNTNIYRHLNETLFWGATSLIGILGPLLKTPMQGAQTAIYCSVDAKCADETGFYYKDCQLATPSKYVEDETNAKRLWSISMEYVNLVKHNPFTEPDRGFRTFEDVLF